MKFELLIAAILVMFAITVVVSFMVGLSIINNAYAIVESPIWEHPEGAKIVSQYDYDNAHKFYDKVIYEGTDVKIAEKDGKEYMIVSEYTMINGEFTFEDFQELQTWRWENR